MYEKQTCSQALFCYIRLSTTKWNTYGRASLFMESKKTPIPPMVKLIHGTMSFEITIRYQNLERDSNSGEL